MNHAPNLPRAWLFLALLCSLLPKIKTLLAPFLGCFIALCFRCIVPLLPALFTMHRNAKQKAPPNLPRKAFFMPCPFTILKRYKKRFSVVFAPLRIVPTLRNALQCNNTYIVNSPAGIGAGLVSVRLVIDLQCTAGTVAALELSSPAAGLPAGTACRMDPAADPLKTGAPDRCRRRCKTEALYTAVSQNPFTAIPGPDFIVFKSPPKKLKFPRTRAHLQFTSCMCACVCVYYHDVCAHTI